MVWHRVRLVLRSAMRSLVLPIPLVAMAVSLGWCGPAAAQGEQLAPVPGGDPVLGVEKWDLRWTVTIEGSSHVLKHNTLVATTESVHWVIEGGAVLDMRTPDDPPPGAQAAGVDPAQLQKFLNTLPEQARAQAREALDKLPPDAQAQFLRRALGIQPQCASWQSRMDARALAPGDPRWDRMKVSMQERSSGTYGDAMEGVGEILGRVSDSWASGTQEMGTHDAPPRLWVDADTQTYWLSIRPLPARLDSAAPRWKRTSRVTQYEVQEYRKLGQSETTTTTEDLRYDVNWPGSWQERGLELLGGIPLWTFVARGAPLGGKPGVLAGRRVYPAKWGSGSLEGTVTIEWTCSPRPSPPVELLVDVSDYDSWLPKGNLVDPDEPGGSVSVRAYLVSSDDHKTPAKQRAKAFMFELVESSQEPGVCMNWPPPDRKQPTDPNDLRFVPALQETAADPLSNSRLLVLPKSATEVTAILHSFDFGGYGMLTVKAVLEDGSVVPGHLARDPGSYNIPIPKRTASRIADSWRMDARNGGGRCFDEQDNDYYGVDWQYPGDGLSVYEEYRGFLVKREHVRTSPMTKTLLVHAEIADVEDGLEILRRATGMQVLRIEPDEYVSDDVRLVNPYHGSCHVVDQHGLHLDLGSLPGAVTGRADALGPPVYVPCVRFNVLTFADLPAQRRDSTIAHEVAHAVGVVHHGRGAHWMEGTLAGPDGKPVAVKAFVTCDGSQHSGNEDCFMRYRAADFIERTPGDPKSWVPYGDPEPPGTRLCISRRATGVNAPPLSKCGAASEGRGDCRSQLRVSDIYPQAEAPD